MAKSIRRIGLLGIILRIINIVLIIALLISYLAQWISPNYFWMIAFFGMAYPILAILNFIFIIHWIFRRRRFVFYPAIALLIGIGMISRFISFGSNTEVVNASNAIKVLSYNVHVFGRYEKGKQSNPNFQRDQIIDFIQDQQPDILCLQEFRSISKSNKEDNIKLISEVCDFKYHYAEKYTPGSKHFYQVIFSKYPIFNSGVVQANSADQEITGIYTDLNIDGQKIRTYSVHLQSFQISSDTYLIKESVDNLDVRKKENQEKLTQTSKYFARKFKLAFEKRSGQIEALKQHVENSPFPIILTGDFNDTPSSYAYGQLSQDLDDAFVKVGFGFGQTYIGPYPSFRIDFILHSPELNTNTFDTWNIKYSDHYPISAVFTLGD